MANNIFITGVSKGLGNAMARIFLERGDKVIGLSRSTPQNLAERDGFEFVSADLADLESLEHNLACLAEQENLDTIILNAGIIGSYGDIADISIKEAKNVEDVNLWANKVILDYCKHNNIPVRQVIAISSGASTSGARGWSAYGVSKAALNMLIALYAAEIEQTHFCSLAPGVVDTDMQEYLFSLEENGMFPTLKYLQTAKGEGKMPSADTAARQIIDALPRIMETVESGSYADIRKL